MMTLVFTNSINALRDSTSELDRATSRVSQFWNDRVSSSIDAEYINRIVDRCESAVAELEQQISRADYLYQRLYDIGPH